MKNEKNKILSTTYAKLSEILILVSSQIIIVPLILSKWDPNMLGIWYILLSTTQLIQLLNLSQHSYLYNKAFILNKKNKKQINKDIFSAIPISIVISLLIILLLLISNKYNFFSNILNIDQSFSQSFNLSIIYLSFVYLTTFSYGTFFYGPFSVYGYYDTYAWLKVVRIFCVSFLPSISIYLGADFILAVYVLIFSEIFSFIIFAIYSIKFFQKLSFKIYKPNFEDGISDFISSLLIFINFVIEYIKNIGFRIIVASIFSPLVVSYFVTTRIITNFIKYIIDGLRDPFHPKLMNSLKKKDEKNVLLIIEFYWHISFVLLCPLAIILQIVLPYIFEIWTYDKIVFMPFLFSFLMMSVLINSIYIPFDMILKGLNKNKSILKISIAAICILFFLIVFFIDSDSFVFIGLVILISEIFVFIGLSYFTIKILLKRKINFNFSLYFLIVLNTINYCAILFVIAYFNINKEIFIYFIFSQLLFIYKFNNLSSISLTQILRYKFKKLQFKKIQK